MAPYDASPPSRVAPGGRDGGGEGDGERDGDHRVVVFDLGGVLIDWDPRHLYRKLLAGPAEVAEFLETVCTSDWNRQQDGGRPIAEATDELIRAHPHHADLIRAYYGRWAEMISGPIHGSVALLERLDQRGVPLYALSNWSAETFPMAEGRFGFLSRFRAIVLSGREMLTKPDPALYRILLERHRLVPSATVFIDDVPANVAAARALGITGIEFQSPEQLERDLGALGLL